MEKPADHGCKTDFIIFKTKKKIDKRFRVASGVCMHIYWYMIGLYTETKEIFGRN
jgi:hypothetical protein